MALVNVDQILMRVRNGQVEAYEELVHAYQREVWKVSAAMLRDAAATDNLVQQVFVNAYFNLEQFRAGADFGVWLKSIARNLVREEIRRRSRSDAHLRHYHDLLAARIDDDSEETFRDELADALRGCREKLPEQAARLVNLRYEQNTDYEVLAREFGRTLEATRLMLSRIRMELRNCVERRMQQS